MSRRRAPGRGVTAPLGYTAAAVSAGLKRSGKPDLALVVSEAPAAAGAIFTRNQCAAAPVVLSRIHLAAARAHRAVLLNSGGANACTGAAGIRDALSLCRGAAAALRCRPQQVLIASTGVIGVRLPVARMLPVLPRLAAARSPRGGPAATAAIMTTDTAPKSAETSLTLGGTRVHIGGMTKGSGMIHPRLATMLAVITTDAKLPKATLTPLLRAACAGTFNAISVDGQTSTNDCVFLLANGEAGPRAGLASASARRDFLAALTEVTDELARAIVRDGEGASKFITVEVTGAASAAEAERAARAVGDSLLVKTAVYGQDANWGRIVSAVGATDVRLALGRIRLDVNGVPLVRRGRDAGTSWAQGNRALAGREVSIAVDLGVGRARARYRTCDLTPRYVDINAGYRS